MAAQETHAAAPPLSVSLSNSSGPANGDVAGSGSLQLQAAPALAGQQTINRKAYLQAPGRG